MVFSLQQEVSTPTQGSVTPDLAHQGRALLEKIAAFSGVTLIPPPDKNDPPVSLKNPSLVGFSSAVVPTYTYNPPLDKLQQTIDLLNTNPATKGFWLWVQSDWMSGCDDKSALSTGESRGAFTLFMPSNKIGEADDLLDALTIPRPAGQAKRHQLPQPEQR